MIAVDAAAVPAPVRPHVPLVIGGRQVEAASGARYTVFNPANGIPVGTAPLAGPHDARRAVASARRAAEKWHQAPVDTRAAVVSRALDRVEEAIDPFAVLLTREQGKPLSESTAEIRGFVARMRTFARLARLAPGGSVPTLSMSAQAYGRVAAASSGVTVALTAWNFPIGLLAKKLGPALMAGQAVVVKPAYTTPLTTLQVVALMNDAGLPPGVLSCVSGHGDEVGAALVEQPGVGRIHLTGDDDTGRAVSRQTRLASRDVVLELAGSDPMLVCADADLDSAARAADEGRFRNAGQACTAVKRVYVASDVYDEFVRRLCALVRRRRAGDGLIPEPPPGVRMGPLHTRAGRDRTEAQLDDAVRRGADVLVGGSRPAAAANAHFLEATLVANVSSASRLVREEVFGPVLPVFRTRSLDEAIALANGSPWRLNASIWTADRDLARRVSPRVACNRLWINRLPFGHEQPDADNAMQSARAADRELT